MMPSKTAKKAGVMALFYPDSGLRTRLLFILRKTYPGVHSNQIGFPGGKQETGDPTLLDTALREAWEEVGIDRRRVTIIRPLSELYIPPSNFHVRPFLGLYDKLQPFRIQQSEVEALVEVPIGEILDHQSLTTRVMTTSYAGEIEVPAYKLAGHIVWGATAMMLSEIKELLTKVM